jgi:hypothetical protein
MAVLTSHVTEEWYTPPRFIALVRSVLGQIDVDPATCAMANTWIKSPICFTAEDDGLKREWYGKVFLNPPFGKTRGKSNQDIWSKKLEAEYLAGNTTEAILLVNSTHGYRWYEYLWHKYPVCKVTDRIRFIKSDGTTGGQAKRGQTFVYFGSNAARFREVFSEVGRVIYPESLEGEALA